MIEITQMAMWHVLLPRSCRKAESQPPFLPFKAFLVPEEETVSPLADASIN